MARMKQDLMIFLKDRKIFTRGGHKTLREWLSDKENQRLNYLDTRNPRKKKGKK
jgi:hypothetical protein